MQSFYNATRAYFPLMKQSDLISTAAALLEQKYMQGGINQASMAMLDAYFNRGQWKNDCSSSVLPELAIHFDCCITIVNGRVNYVVGPPRGKPVTIYRNRRHFSHLNGGAVDKFPEIIKACAPLGDDVLDVSAAPGYLSLMLNTVVKNLTYGVYHGEGACQLTQKPVGHRINYNSTASLCDALGDRRFDTIINDAARAVNSEAIIDELNTSLLRFLKRGGSLLSKTFGNPHELWRLAEAFSDVKLIYASEKCTERYFLLTGYLNGSTKFFDHYDKWNLTSTMHTARLGDLNRFVREFFTGEFAKHAPKVPAIKKKFFEFRAYTGYASASKTTNAIRDHPRAVFIAPTRELALRHQKMGVASYTQHVFFSKKHDNCDTIIIDEISQFPLDYVGLVAHMYPQHRVCVLGDVEQTPYVNYANARKMDTVRDIGVRNNVLDVYKIPQDVTNMINKKHGFMLRSKSAVQSALAIFKGDVRLFRSCKIPVICFNSASAQHLRDQGVNASTITTYTGSRDHTVVFYVDSDSVASQLANRSEMIYTAVTRATDRLVFAGDTDYLCKYYCIHGSPIMLYEQIAQAYICHKTIQADDTQLPVTVPTSVSVLPASLDVVTSTLQHMIRPANDPHSEYVSVSKAEIPEVESGRFRAPVDSLLAIDETKKGYRMTDLRFAKHQTSTSTIEASQTLIKRYSRRYKNPMNKRNYEFTHGELLRGFGRAVYGRDHVNYDQLKADMTCDHDYIAERMRQYIDALDKKMRSNPAAAAELKEEFHEATETLNFFNKKQSKFDPAVAFDTSDKVGQGVAATSKRINLIYGAIARAMLDRVRELLLKYKRNIILATHGSEAGINDLYTSMVEQFRPIIRRLRWACNDMKEWDASFRKSFTHFLGTLMRLMGVHEPLVAFYMEYRDDWQMKYRHAYGTSVLTGKEKQFSGDPFTICINTICNMSMCFAIFEYDGFRMALFKGDDSAVLASACRITEKGKRMIEITGHGLKLHTSSVGEFAGWFLTPYGLFPDPVRYAAKFVDRTYLNQKHFEESLESLQERCRAAKTQDQVMHGIDMCHMHYSQALGGDIPISPSDIENLFGFIKNSRQIRFKSLKPVVQTTRHV